MRQRSPSYSGPTGHRVTDLYLAATTPDSEGGVQVSAGEDEALRGAVQQLIAHAERLRAALKTDA